MNVLCIVHIYQWETKVHVICFLYLVTEVMTAEVICFTLKLVRSCTTWQRWESFITGSRTRSASTWVTTTTSSAWPCILWETWWPQARWGCRAVWDGLARADRVWVKGSSARCFPSVVLEMNSLEWDFIFMLQMKILYYSFP